MVVVLVFLLLMMVEVVVVVVWRRCWWCQVFLVAGIYRQLTQWSVCCVKDKKSDDYLTGNN